MQRKILQRMASAVVAGVMAMQVVSPVLSYADDSPTITAGESDVTVDTGNPVEVTSDSSDSTENSQNGNDSSDSVDSTNNSDESTDEDVSGLETAVSDSSDSVSENENTSSDSTVSNEETTNSDSNTSTDEVEQNTPETTVPHESVTITINRNGGKFEDLWIDTANEDTLAAHADGDEAMLSALGLTDNSSDFTYEDNGDTLTVHVADKGSVVIPDALSTDENAHFVKWDVSGGSYDTDTDTLTFEDGVDAYTLTAVYESNEEVDADLVDNADAYNSASEDDGIATISLDPYDTPNYNQLDLVIEGLEFTSKHGLKQTFTAPYTGDYIITAYGANGGTGKNKFEGFGYPGRGGMAEGKIHLEAGQTIYMYLGEAGRYWSTERTFGGGGGQIDWDRAWYPDEEEDQTNKYHVFGRGGGATYVTIDNWTMDQAGQAPHDYWDNEKAQNNQAAENAKKHVILLAGGGGGAGEYGGASNGGGEEGQGVYAQNFYAGGFPPYCNAFTFDATIGGTTATNGRKQTWEERLEARVYPATQTRAGYGNHYTILGELYDSNPHHKNPVDNLFSDGPARACGSFFYGSNGFTCSGAGGGGWFGGGGDYAFNGGGGSSFVNTSITYKGESVAIEDANYLTGGNAKFDSTESAPYLVDGRVIIRMDGATPKMAVVMQEAANEEGSKDHIDADDIYGQAVTLNKGQDVASTTVTYTAITYYNLGDIMTVTPSWDYSTYLDYHNKSWTDATAKSLDGRMSVNIQNTTLGQLKPTDKYYNENYPDWYAVKSVMTLTNPVNSMYNTTTMKKYFFRCSAIATYQTSGGQRQMSDVGEKGGLVIDYNIYLEHQGIHVYDNRNIINGTEVKTIKDSISATNNHAYSVWQYPELSITEPNHINSVLVQFSSREFNSNDRINYDANYASSLGIKSSSSTNYSVIFTAATENSVSTETWEKLLRSVTFTTYDSATFTSTGVEGGVTVFWYADENLWKNDMFYDSTTGHFYAVVNKGASVSWDAARAEAKSMYNSALDTYGYLVHITSEAEQNYLLRMMGTGIGWMGAARNFDGVSGWDWYWVDGPSNETSAPFFRQNADGVYGTLLWGYENWSGKTEPNNSGGVEDAGHFYADGRWNDFNKHNESVICFIVEWSKDGLKPNDHSVSDTDVIGTQVKSTSTEVEEVYTSIAGTVWAENDRDGIYQTGDEATVEGVSVTLYDANGTTLATMTTNKYGNYSFDKLTPNTKYSVGFLNGSSNIQSYTPTLKGAASENNSRVNANWRSDVFVAIAQNNSVNTVNCGVFVPSTLSGFVWDDTNRDGIYNNNEAKLKNANITVLTGEGNAAYDVYGNQITSIKTDTNGNYSISNLKPRQTYTIKVLSATGTNLSNARVSPLPDKSTDKSVSNKASKITSILGVIGRPSGASENVGETFSGAEINSIYIPTMSGNKITPVAVQHQNVALYVNHGISGYVWAESDYNGVFDGFIYTSTNAEREPALSGIKVNLKDANGTIKASTTTDTAGYYQFPDVLEGNYTIEFVNSDKIIVEGRETGASSGLYDFEVSPKAASKTNAPGNGTTGVFSNSVLMSAVSDKITIKQVALASASGEENAYVETTNCGLYVPTYIHGQVWADGNKDGTKDTTESRIQGVKVSLATTDGKPVTDVYGNKVADVITGADGKYTFRGIPVGTYRIDINSGTTDISEFAVTKFQVDGVDESVNNDARNGESGNKASIDWVKVNNLNDNTYKTNAANKNFTGKINHDQSTVYDMDAGLIRAQSISGLVWAESDYNMRRDDGERRIAGIKVSLLDENNNVAKDSNGNLLTTKTDANGEYSFVDLPNGKYRVAVFKSAVMPTQNYKYVPKWVGKSIPSTDPKVSNFDADFDQAPTGATYADYISAQTFDFTGNVSTDSVLHYEHIDFGFFIQHGVSGKVWLDENGDGVIDKDEPVISNVTVSIVNKDGSTVKDIYGNEFAPVTTDKDGNYNFDLVPNGEFTIVVKNGDTVIDHFEVSPKQNDNNATGTPNENGILEKAEADVTMTPNSTDEETNIGFTVNRTIYGVSFIDYNENGERETADTTIKDIKVSLKTKGLLAGIPKDVYGKDVVPVLTEEIQLPDGTTAVGYKFEHLKAGTYDVVFDGKDSTTLNWEELSSTKYQVVGVDLSKNSDTKDSKTLLTNKLDVATATVSVPLFETNSDNLVFENSYIDNGLKAPLTITKTANKPDGTILAPGQSLTYTITVETTSRRDDFTVQDVLPDNMALVSDVTVAYAGGPASIIPKDTVENNTVVVKGPFSVGKTTISYTMIANEFGEETFKVVHNKAVTVPVTPNVPGAPDYPETPNTEHFISDGSMGDFTKTVALVDADNNVDAAQTGSEEEPILTNIHQTLEYTLQFKYDRAVPADGNVKDYLSGKLVVTDPLPTDTTYIKKSTNIHFSDGSTAKLKSFKRDAENSLVWTFDKLAPGEVVTIKFRVYAPVTSDDPTTTEYETSKVFTNKATLLDVEKEYKLYEEDVTETLPDGSTIEHKKGDRMYPNGEALTESNSTYNVVKEPRLIGIKAIDGKESGDKVKAGEELTYTITLTNKGEISATNIVLKDPIPGHSTFVSASDEGKFDSDSDMVTWNLGTLAVGESKTVTLVVKVGSTTTVDKLIINAADFTYQPEDQTGENTPPEKTPTIPGKTNEVNSRLDGNPAFPTPDHTSTPDPNTPNPTPSIPSQDNPNKPNDPTRPGVYIETVISKAAAAFSGITIPRTGTNTNGTGTEEAATNETATAETATASESTTPVTTVVIGIAILVAVGAGGTIYFKKRKHNNGNTDSDSSESND